MFNISDVSYCSKITILALILIVNFKLSIAWFEYCSHEYTLQPNSSIYINSPYYPRRYPAGSSCRYIIRTAVDHEINIECNLSIDKPSTQCSSDFMYISIDGDSELRSSEYFCGDGYIQRKSMFNRLVLAYTSSTNQYAGQFACLLTSRPQPCDCGWLTQRSRISGGVEARINEYPFMTGILHVPSKKVYCGGVLISHRYVLSAAHCFLQIKNTNELNVVLGDHDLRTGAETPYTRVLGVSRVQIHEQYSPNQSDANDIALIQTATIVEWSLGIGPACLPLLYSFADFTGVNADLVGWGTTSFSGPSSPVLMKATVKVISNSECQKTFPNLVNSQICAYSPPKDSCQQDSGGPLVVRLKHQFVVGLISYGKPCGTNTPSVNTRITSYLKWIQYNTGENFCAKT